MPKVLDAMPSPIGETHFGERLRGVDAGVVDQDVATAKAGFDAADQRRHVVRRGDVASERGSLPAGALDHGHRLLGGLTVGDRDVHPVLGEPSRERLADARRTSGDDRDLALVSSCHCVRSLVAFGQTSRAASSDSARRIASSVASTAFR